MSYILKLLLSLSFSSILVIILSAHGYITLEFSHIELAIPAVIFLIFIQAFVMFYFIGVARMVENVHHILSGHKKENLKELFENPPEDLTPYLKKVNRFVYGSKVAKRQTIPWTALILTLGCIGFLLGGAHHTGVVQKIIHSGVIYGFAVSLTIGFFRQWHFLGKCNQLLREIKALFEIPDSSM